MRTNTETTTPLLSRSVLGVLAALGLGSMALTMTGCNTVEGVGEDMEAAGDAIADKADEERD